MQFPPLTNHENRPLDQVQLTGMLMSCVIGIFPAERTKKQPVTIDMCLYLDTRRAAKSANIHDTIDYAGAVKEISFILDNCEFQLIETAVEAICRHFLLTYQADHNLPTIDAVVVKISKPSALTNGIVPAVQILRFRADYQMSAEEFRQHSRYTVHQAQDSLLVMLVASDASKINILDAVPTAAAVLPIGRWSLNGSLLKSRQIVPVLPNSSLEMSIPSHTAASSRVLLIQGRP